MSVAFCFMISNNHNHSELWEKFFSTANPTEYNIYTHLYKKPSKTLLPWLESSKKIKTMKTEWCGESLLYVLIKLLHEALKNKDNKYFVLSSESCIPLYNFGDTIKQINMTTRARFNYYKWDAFNSKLYKADQWCILTRKTAKDLIKLKYDKSSSVKDYLSNIRYELYENNGVDYGCFDEIVPINWFKYLYKKDFTKYVKNEQTTFTVWKQNANSPIIMKPKDITRHFCKDVGKSLFARKFDEKSAKMSAMKCSKHTNNIPKIIWSFWDGPNKEKPEIINKCIESWKFYNPKYKIKIVSIKSANKLLKGIKHPITNKQINIYDLKHIYKTDGSGDILWQRASDYARALLLAKYGGIWMDASNIATRSFDEWFLDIIPNGYKPDFIGYYLDEWTTLKKYPVIENWFFACPKHGKFINLWKDEFLTTDNYTKIYDYIKDKKNQGIKTQRIGDKEKEYLSYLAMHVSAQAILQNPKFIKSSANNNMILMNAEIHHNPYYYLFKSNQNTRKALTKLGELTKRKAIWCWPFIKLRGPEREFLDSHPDYIKKIFKGGFAKFPKY